MIEVIPQTSCVMRPCSMISPVMTSKHKLLILLWAHLLYIYMCIYFICYGNVGKHFNLQQITGVYPEEAHPVSTCNAIYMYNILFIFHFCHMYQYEVCTQYKASLRCLGCLRDASSFFWSASAACLSKYTSFGTLEIKNYGHKKLTNKIMTFLCS